MPPALDTGLLERTTRAKFLPVLKNNLYNKTRVMKVLFMKNRIKPWTGTALNWTVIGKKHASVGLFGGYSTLANQPINPGVPASLADAKYYATIAISWEEEKKNSGSMEKLLDLLKVQMQNAESTLRDRISTDMYGAGTTVGGFQPLIGFAAAIDTDNTYAGIDRSAAANAFWRANQDATSYTDAQLEDPTTAGYLPRVMYDLYTDATHDGSPNLVFTTKKIYNIYQLIAQRTNLRFNNDIANLGFGGVEFGPGVTMIFDDYCTDRSLFMINTDDWQLFLFDGGNFDFAQSQHGGIWKEPTDQLAKVAHILFAGQLRCDAPWQQGHATTVGAASS